MAGGIASYLRLSFQTVKRLAMSLPGMRVGPARACQILRRFRFLGTRGTQAGRPGGHQHPRVGVDQRLLLTVSDPRGGSPRGAARRDDSTSRQSISPCFSSKLDGAPRGAKSLCIERVPRSRRGRFGKQSPRPERGRPKCRKVLDTPDRTGLNYFMWIRLSDFSAGIRTSKKSTAFLARNYLVNLRHRCHSQTLLNQWRFTSRVEFSI